MNLKELSAHLGLSPTTVSRALGGYPEVNAKTRARVTEAAARLNYRPNKRAQALATGRSFNIGHVLSTSDSDALVNPIFGDFIAGLTETSALRGYSLSLSLTDQANEAATYQKLKSEGSVDGVVLQSPSAADARIALLTDIGLPFVVHGRASDIDTPYAWVDVNNRRAFQRATEFLIDLGHRRIGLINGHKTMDFAERRRDGYASALAAAGLAADPALTRSGPMTEERGFSAVQALLNVADPPSAFVVSSITLAMGARRAIEQAGLRLGADVSLVAYDDDLSYLGNRQNVPVFTAVRSSVRLAGQKVAEMLLGMVDHPPDALPSVLLEAELVVGASTGPLSKGT